MTRRAEFLRDFSKAVADDSASIFVGAGVSMAAGYPSWKDLLYEIAEDLGVDPNNVTDLAALAQWAISKRKSRAVVTRRIKEEIAVEKPIPDVVQSIARLPIRNLWTSNYDTLIERAFGDIRRPCDTITNPDDLSIRRRAGATRLYKMHGSVTDLTRIVIATGDYESYRRDRGAFTNLLQSHLSSLSMLFVGLSFTDQNVKHVLAQIVDSFGGSPPEHYAIVKPPQRKDYRSDIEYDSMRAQHDLWADDLLRYGLGVVEIDDYDDLPALFVDLERAVKRDRIWISGSWPANSRAPLTQYVYDVSEALGKALADQGYSLVSGAGTMVGSASLSSFMTGLGHSSWEVERRLVALPFPQPVGDREPNREQWSELRDSLAQASGAALFVGGLKRKGRSTVLADGVFEELEAARRHGLFILPVGSTGGAAAEIARGLLEWSSAEDRDSGLIPAAEDLVALMERTPPEKTAARVVSILKARGQRAPRTARH